MLSKLGIRKGTAKHQKDWSYSIQPAAPAANQTDGWLDKLKELMKVKNASLQQLIAGGFGQTGAKLYAITANHINQAVLGFTQTTANFEKQQQLPKYVSIPDTLNMQGQAARCYAETCFQKFIGENLQRLRDLAEVDLIKEFTQFKLNLRQGFVSTGMGDLQTKLLTVAEAKKRKADIALRSRKQQRLLQAEQPRFVECIAYISKQHHQWLQASVYTKGTIGYVTPGAKKSECIRKQERFSSPRAAC